MLYLATSPNEPAVADLLNRRRIGLMCQPASNRTRSGWIWAADNGCFNETWKPDVWERWLRFGWPRTGCLFATTPDVVSDYEATLELFEEYSPTIRGARYPVAFVAQDGQPPDGVPWSQIDCLFIGGSDEYKMGDDAFALAQRARAREKWVHVGRVNSWKRYQAWAAHADSCDGTFLAFGPRNNIPKLMRWVDGYDRNPQLWSA